MVGNAARLIRTISDHSIAAQLDQIVVPSGFDAPDNEVVLVAAEGERRLEKAAKEQIAAAILDAVAERLDGAR